MKLSKYEFKSKIRVALVSGTVFIAESWDFFRKEDFDAEYDELALRVDKILVNTGDVRHGGQYAMPENEIKSIEIL